MGRAGRVGLTSRWLLALLPHQIGKQTPRVQALAVITRTMCRRRMSHKVQAIAFGTASLVGTRALRRGIRRVVRGKVCGSSTGTGAKVCHSKAAPNRNKPSTNTSTPQKSARPRRAVDSNAAVVPYVVPGMPTTMWSGKDEKKRGRRAVLSTPPTPTAHLALRLPASRCDCDEVLARDFKAKLDVRR